MRPLELRLSGFRSYRGPATFDFRGRSLVGIVGPNGAGKSSILDSIVFALYGKTPVVRSGTRSLIHQLEDQLHVSLRFEVDGETWQVVRALRRRGQAGHQLTHLDADGPEAVALETITGEAPIARRVEQLLGLDFGAFCRSVLLAQDRFSEFLNASSGQRDSVLKGVFGYERLDLAQIAARLRLQLAEGSLETLALRRRDIDEARVQLDAARAAAADSERALRSLEAVKPRVDELSAVLVEVATATGSARAAIAETEEIVASLPGTDDIGEAVDAATGARRLVDAATDALAAAAADRAQRRAELEDLEARLGDRERFQSFGSLVLAHEQQVRAIAEATEALARSSAAIEARRATIADAHGALAGSAAAVEEAERGSVASERTVEGARGTLEAARHGEMARVLRGELVVGADCPVCGRPVEVVPKGAAARKVKTAETALARAEGTLRAAQAAVRDAASAHAAAEASLQGAHVALEAAEAEHVRVAETSAAAEAAGAATRSQLAEWLGEEGDPRALFDARAAERTGAEAAVAEASAAWEAARAELDRLQEAATGADARVTSIAGRLAGAWGRLGRQREIPPDPGALRDAFAEIGAALVTRHEAAVALVAEAEARRDGADRERAALLAEAGVGPLDDLARAIADAAATHAGAARRVSDLSSRIAESDALEREAMDAERRRDIARRLCDDLRPSQFLAYLLEEERAELAALGSEHLEQLTGGDFRFTDDATFGIVDRNAAGAERKAESLSGGETFLASLALAIALAEMVTRGGGRLDAFFLDEGFGSLDPEHLELAMDGIGRLVADDVGRLVVLVSHVAEMREAIEDLIVLDKDDLSGDTVVVAGNEPA